MNNKTKQKAGGNWGHPRPYIKKATNNKLKDDAKKALWDDCPFCPKKKLDKCTGWHCDACLEVVSPGVSICSACLESVSK